MEAVATVSVRACVCVRVDLNLHKHASPLPRLCRHASRWDGWTRPNTLLHHRSPARLPRVLPARLLEAAAVLVGQMLPLTHVR